MKPLFNPHFNCFFVFLFCAFCGLANAVEVSRFDLDRETLLSGQQIKLNGSWWFSFGEHVPINELRSKIEAGQIGTLNVPQPWNDAVAELTDNPYQHGSATYALPLRIPRNLGFAISLNVSYIAGGYRLYWLPAGSNESIIIGTSGDWQSGAYTGIESESYSFTGESEGLLIAHITKQNMYKGGIRQPISIQRSEFFHRADSQNWVVRGILIGSLFVMSLHYLVQYRFSRDNLSTLLLSILCFAAALRSASTAGFIELFVQQWTVNHFLLTIKTEYLSLVLLPVSYFIFLNYMLPRIVPKFIIYFAVLSWLIASLLTIYLPAPLISKYLDAYLLFLSFWSAAVIVVMVVGVLRKLRFSWQIFISSLILGAGGVNDVIASRSSTHNIYLVEYVFFIFLFFQAQLVGQQLRDSLSRSNRLSKEKEDLQQAHSKALMESHHDHLTGLANRTGLKKLEDSFEFSDSEKGVTTGVVMLDLDYFKHINDTYGHDIGDEILVYVASLLHGYSLRISDFKCRYGGEEFLLILPGASLDRAEEMAESLRSRLENSIAYSDNKITLKVTASFGVAVHHSGKGVKLKEAIIAADKALYRAKNRGRNCVSL